MKYCKYCGSAIDSNSVFCEVCGCDLRIGADAKPNAKTTVTPPAVIVPRTGGDWCKLMYTAFVLWGISFILLFLDWFSINYTAGIMGGYTVMSFNLFSLNSMVQETGNDGLAILSVFIWAFSAVFVCLSIATVILFLKRHRKMFGVGIALSSTFAAFSAIALAVLYIGVSDMSSEDPLSGAIINSALKVTAVPYILIIVNIAAFVIMLFARRGYIDEFGLPASKKQRENRLEMTLAVYSLIMSILYIINVILFVIRSTYFIHLRAYTSGFSFLLSIFLILSSISAAIYYFVTRRKTPERNLYVCTALILGFFCTVTSFLYYSFWFFSDFFHLLILPIIIMLFKYTFRSKTHTLRELSLLSVIYVTAGALSALCANYTMYFPGGLLTNISWYLLVFVALALAGMVVFFFFKKRTIHIGFMKALGIVLVASPAPALIAVSIFAISIKYLRILRYDMILFFLLLIIIGIFIIKLSKKVEAAQESEKIDEYLSGKSLM